MTYFLHILIYIGIFSILAMSLNLLAGYTGILSMAHAAFYGIGAYAAAMLSLRAGTPFLLNTIIGMALAAVLGAVVGFPSLRIKDDYFIIATFAFQVIVYSILNNWVSFTGGPMGLPGIPQPVIFGWTISSHFEYLMLTLVLAGFTFWVCRRIVNSPWGRALKGIREDEIWTMALGRNAALFKVKTFMVSAALAALAGALYAVYISFIDPSSFTVMESVFMISMVIIGGSGSLWGPVLGAAVLTVLPELLRFVGLPGSVAANLRQILYGGALIAFMIWRPRGLIGAYAFFRGGSGKAQTAVQSGEDE